MPKSRRPDPLPSLPPGWEWYDHTVTTHSDVSCIRATDELGWVTIDWKQQAFGLGSIGRAPYGATKFEGRRWRQDLVAGAIQALEDNYKSILAANAER